MLIEFIRGQVKAMEVLVEALRASPGYGSAGRDCDGFCKGCESFCNESCRGQGVNAVMLYLNVLTITKLTLPSFDILYRAV